MKKLMTLDKVKEVRRDCKVRHSILSGYPKLKQKNYIHNKIMNLGTLRCIRRTHYQYVNSRDLSTCCPAP